MNEINVQQFSADALPEIEKLARHYNIQESVAVEVYGHITVLLNPPKAPTFEDCISFIKEMLTKPVTQLTYEEGRIGLGLGLLRVKQKPFLSDPTLKLRRNDLCPCGSGAKFKNCCLDSVRKHNFERYQQGLTI